MKKYLFLIVFLSIGFLFLSYNSVPAFAGCCTSVDCGADHTCSGPSFDDNGVCVSEGSCQYAGGNDCGACRNGSWCEGWSVPAGQACGPASTGCGGCGGGGGTPPTPTPTNTPTPTPTPLGTLPAQGSSNPITCGNACREDGWTGPISVDAIGLPSGSSGSIRAQADFVYVNQNETYPGVTPATYKQYLSQTIVRGNNSYIRTVPIDSSGSPLWSDAASWLGPYGIPSFCSGQQIQSLDYKLEGTAPNQTLTKSLWCNNTGYIAKFNFINGNEESAVSGWGWKGHTYTVSSSWPSGSSGELQGQADYAICDDNNVNCKTYKNVWRGNQGWSMDDKQGFWTAWSKSVDLTSNSSDLPGSGNMQVVQNTVFPNSTLMQSFWRGDQGWVRSIPINADQDPVWGQAYNSVCESGSTCSGGICKLNTCVNLPCTCTAKTYTQVNYIDPQGNPLSRNVCQASWECGSANGTYSSCADTSSYFSENTSAGQKPNPNLPATYNCSGAYTYGITDIVRVTPVPASGYEANNVAAIPAGKYRGWPNWTGLQTLNIVLTSPTPTPRSPSISNLQIGNVRPTGTSTYRIAGNQSGQGGANWYNPMNITVTATKGTLWNGTEFSLNATYVALYDKSLTQVTNKATLVSTVQGYIKVANNAANAKKGLLLAYGSNIVSGQSGHFVWDPTLNSGNGGWFNIPVNGSRIVCESRYANNQCIPATILYIVWPNGNFSWQVGFDRNFGSKNLYTAVYVKDSNDKDAFNADITPVTP